MMITRNGAHGMHEKSKYTSIFMLSVWGFVIVISSFLFLYAGYWLVTRFHSEPTFMLGLFFLGIFLCVGRLYWEAWMKRGHREE